MHVGIYARVQYKEWRPLYEKILAEFGFSEQEDAESARLLDSLLPLGSILSVKELDALMRGRDVFVVGAAVKDIDIAKIPDGAVIVAAGDSMVSLAKTTHLPAVVVSDLDGDIESQISASEYGAYTIIHAHGDNVEALRREIPRFSGKMMGTAQTAPVGKLHNFGGFTDGDRAVLLAEEMGAKRIILIGFDFQNPTPKPGRDPMTKLRKLAWAKKIIKTVKKSEVLLDGVRLN